MKDIMLDIETLGTGNNAVIIQIGVCEFDRLTGEIGGRACYNLNLKDSLNKGFEIDADTLKWWLQQDQNVFNDILNDDQCTPKVILNELSKIFKDKCVWCHATFDVPLLNNYFKKYDVWGNIDYRKVRDIRTLVDITNFDLDSLDWTNKTHNALDDCIFQVDYVTKALTKGVNND